MNNTLKTYAAIAAGFIIAQMALFTFIIIIVQLIWPHNTANILAAKPVFFLIFSMFNLAVLVLIALLFISAQKQEHEKYKIYKEEEIRKEKAEGEKKQYEHGKKERLERENYEKVIEFYKYLHQSGDCNDPKTGFPEKEEFDKINQIISTHMNIISNQNNSSKK